MFITASMLSAGPAASDDFWYGPVGVVSASGATVSADSALRLSVVFACVRVLSESVAKIPLRMMRGVNEVVTDHPLARLVSRRPNRWQTAFEFREMLQAHLCLRSNAYAQIVYARNGDVAELVPLHPDRVKVEQVGDFAMRYIVTDWQSRQRALTQDEVLHIRQLPLDGFCGLSTVATQREPIGSALSAQEYAGRFFRNGAKHGGMWIEMPGKFESDEARARFRAAWRASLSGSNAYDTPIMDRGMKLHELGMTNADAQFIESRKYSDSDLCRMFLVPPHMVGILDRATNNNIEQQSAEFYQGTLMGLFRRWEEAFEVQLLTDDEAAELRFEFDVRQLLRANSDARSKYWHNAIVDGWLTRNEVRLEEGYEALPGLDEPLHPLNMGPNRDREPADDGRASDEGRAQAILRAAADRVVVRECNALQRLLDRRAGLDAAADFYGAHAGWMAQVMAIAPELAERVCERRFDALRAAGGTQLLIDDWRELGGAELLRIMQ
jgi:HK97 family phage portal protein